MADKDNPVYFIGAGPGDARYLTMEGKEALFRCSLVYAVEPYPVHFAHLLVGRKVRDPFSMGFDELVGEINEALPSAPVGFMVPGDITVFSPFLPVVEHFGRRAKVIAGVGILNASAALLKRSMDMPGVSHSVLLTSPKYHSGKGGKKNLRRLAAEAGTLVLYMNNLPLEELEDVLSEGFGPDTPVAIVSRVGMPEEKVYRCTLSTMPEAVGEDDMFGFRSGDPSLVLIIVGGALDAMSSPEFWDQSKRRYWDREKQ